MMRKWCSKGQQRSPLRYFGLFAIGLVQRSRSIYVQDDMATSLKPFSCSLFCFMLVNTCARNVEICSVLSFHDLSSKNIKYKKLLIFQSQISVGVNEYNTRHLQVFHVILMTSGVSDAT